jgi:hypothetical protein
MELTHSLGMLPDFFGRLPQLFPHFTKVFLLAPESLGAGAMYFCFRACQLGSNPAFFVDHPLILGCIAAVPVLLPQYLRSLALLFSRGPPPLGRLRLASFRGGAPLRGARPTCSLHSPSSTKVENYLCE